MPHQLSRSLQIVLALIRCVAAVIIIWVTFLHALTSVRIDTMENKVGLVSVIMVLVFISMGETKPGLNTYLARAPSYFVRKQIQNEKTKVGYIFS